MLSESHISTSQSPIYYPTYDGNGNVSENLAANGTIAAHFEYDPFGNTVVNTDTSNQFSYRFSTKPIAFATGLYYYGYRYYDPMTGRWPSRDPIEEEGGVNLYGFVLNMSINGVDILGLREKRNCKKFTRSVQLSGGGVLGAPVSWFSVTADWNFAISETFEYCQECCGDGEWKDVYETGWEISASGGIHATGGPQVNTPVVSGFFGLRLSGEIVGNGGKTTREGGCSGENPDGNVEISVKGQGSITGGGQLSVNLWLVNVNLVQATATGSASRGLKFKLNCTRGNGCSYKGMEFDGEWQFEAKWKACIFNNCLEGDW